MLGLFLGGGLILVLLLFNWFVLPHSQALLTTAFLLGALAALVSVFPERYLVGLLVSWIQPLQPPITFLVQPLVASFLEETIKFILLHISCHKITSNKSAYLFILIGIALGLGFASAENLWYALSYNLNSIYWRLPSSLVHSCLSSLIALKIFQRKSRLFFVIALLWHSAYNIALEKGAGLAILLFLLFYTGWQLWRGLSL